MRIWVAPAIALVIASILGGALLFHKRENVQSDITLYGNVDVRQVDIAFRVDGRVMAMPFEEGDFVRAGELMATLDVAPYADQLEEAKAKLISSERSLANAELQFQRRQELVGEGGVSVEDYQDSLTSRDVWRAKVEEDRAAVGVALTHYEDTCVFAPVDGTILTRVREPGSVVLEGQSVYTLSVISPIWIRAFLSEVELGLVYPGMEAEVFTDTPGGPSYRGHVGFISPVAEFTPKTVESLQLRNDLVYRIRVTVDNPDWGLKQGMPVTVKLHPKKAGEECLGNRCPD